MSLNVLLVLLRRVSNIEENDTLFVYYSNKNCQTCFSIHNFLRQISVADRLFSEYDNEVELESDNANQNQTSTTSSFFVASDQEFMQQFQDQIVNELFQVFN